MENQIHNLFDKALEYLDAGDNEAAIIYLERVIKEDPQYILAYLRMGDAYDDNGQPDEAEKSYRACLEIRPGEPRALVNLSKVLFDQGKLEDAARIGAQAIEVAPEDTSAYINFGNACDDLGRTKDALEAYKKARSIDPLNPVILGNMSGLFCSTGDFDDALYYANQALEYDSFLDVAHVNKALALQGLGRNNDALDAYRDAFRALPGNIPVIVGMADLLVEMERFGEALKLGRKAVDSNPESPRVLTSLAAVLELMDKKAEALEILHKAVEYAPRFGPAHRQLGAMLAKDNDTIVEGAEHLMKAAALSPGDESAQYQMAYGLSRLWMKGHREETISLLHNWREKVGHHPFVTQCENAFLQPQDTKKCPQGYVRRLFDFFANSFNENLANLGYNPAQHVAKALLEQLGPGQQDKVVLDAGCGTGLCGPFLKQYAADEGLFGVDISKNMLDIARETDIYDTLYESELLSFFKSLGAEFDLVVASDVFNYFGALDELVLEMTHALKFDGIACFNVEREANCKNGYILNPTGRFSHTASYIKDCIGKAGLSIEKFDSVVLRYEDNRPVQFFMVIVRKKMVSTDD